LFDSWLNRFRTDWRKCLHCTTRQNRFGKKTYKERERERERARKERSFAPLSDYTLHLV